MLGWVAALARHFVPKEGSAPFYPPALRAARARQGAPTRTEHCNRRGTRVADPDEGMRFEPTPIDGVVVVTPDVHADERGFFARSWDCDEFIAHGLNARIVQRNLSYNHAAATLRGLHFQRAPHAEAKLVACVTGALFDVAVDLRPASPTFGRWQGVELRASTGTMLYIGEGCAHGFITLEPQTSVEYLMSEFFHAESASGVRWDDPAFGIAWPCEPRVISARDRAWPDFAAPR